MLDVKRGQSLLMRGATSALGQAACHFAINAGATVTATSRRREPFPQVQAMCVHAVKLEGLHLVSEFEAADSKFNAILNVVRSFVLIESMTVVRRGGRLCQAGWLGGLEPIDNFNPMTQMATGVESSLFHSKVFGHTGVPTLRPTAAGNCSACRGRGLDQQTVPCFRLRGYPQGVHDFGF